MEIELPFGAGHYRIQLPDENVSKVLQAPHGDPLRDCEAAIEAALAAPHGCAPLARKAKSALDAVVVICDMTRPVPNRVILPPILRTLEAAGIARQNITLLVATGLHRPNNGPELEAMVGSDIAAAYRIVNHRARQFEEQVHLGVTERGTPIDIDAVYARASLKISTGYIEPHLMAGFSGGRKVVAIGCGGERLIRAVHSPAFIEHPCSIEGTLRGNILHEELTTIARRAGMDFMVNVTLDRGRRVTGVFAGELEAAFTLGCQFARAALTDTVDQPCDVVVTSCGGFPQDCTYYQSAKGLTGAMHVAAAGGTIIMLTACDMGFGGEGFRELCRSLGSRERFEQDFIRGPRSEIDQWQPHNVVRAMRKCECIMVDRGLSGDDRTLILPKSADSFAAALESAWQRHGRGARIAVIPDGPNVLATVANVG